MESLEYIKSSSPLLTKVQQLGDQCRNTVGFMPGDAFWDYAKKQHILVAHEHGNVLGYAMFRYRNNDIILVHLCVNAEHRKKGLAKKLIRTLCSDHFESNINGIILKCRRDYNIDDFWHKIGFRPIGETAGRSKSKNTILTVWFLSNPKRVNLFDHISDADESNISVFLDTNVVINMADAERNHTVHPLLADYISLLSKFFISSDVLSELNKYSISSVRRFNVEYAKNHFDIRYENALPEYSLIYNDLTQTFPVSSTNSKYDASHISLAAAYAANAFITEDKQWLNSQFVEYVFEKYALRILSPAQFTLYLDEITNATDYSPYRLAGLGLIQRQLNSSSVYKVVSDLSPVSGQTKSQFSRKIDLLIADNQEHTLMTLFSKEWNRYFGLYDYIIENQKTVISEFYFDDRDFPPTIAISLVKYFAFKFLEIASANKCSCLRIMDSQCTKKYASIFMSCDYLSDGKTLYRYLHTGVASKADIELMYLQSQNSLDNLSFKDFFLLEKKYWPLKIFESGIPNYIVPIRADYAVELFDEELANINPSMFDNQHRLPALNPENVYFKSSKNTISKYPAHVLWYVSNSKMIGCSCIRAISMLDRVEIGTAKELYHKYHRLGVLKWDQLMQYTNNDAFGKIACYVFSYTQIFSHPVSLDEIRKSSASLLKATFQSQKQITQEVFLKLYNLGMGI